MIYFADQIKIKMMRDFFKDNPEYEAQVMCAYDMYGNSSDCIGFWNIVKEERMIGIIFKWYDTANIYLSDMPDRDELLSFLRFTGVGSVLADQNYLNGSGSNVYLMTAGTVKTGREIPIKRIKKLDEIYHLSFKEQEADFESWLCDISHKVRHGISEWYGIYENDELLSCCGILAASEKYELVGDAFTREDCRGRGYAGSLIRQISEMILGRKKTPQLFCEKEDLKKYYETFGYKVTETFKRMDLKDIK